MLADVSPHLKLSSDIYDEYEIEDQETMPISEIDTECISLIIEITEKLGFKPLRDVLIEWKDHEDKEVRDKLLSLSTSIKKPVFSPRHFVEIGDSFKIDVKFLSTVSVKDHYCFDKNRNIYSIIVNEDPQEKVLFANQIVEFLSPDQRDEEIDRLKEALKESNVHFT